MIVPFLCALLAALLPAASDTVSGRVLDAQGHPVHGAEVTLAELRRSAVTAANGRFQLGSVAPGRYTLSVRHFDFAPFSRSIEVPGSELLTLTLRSSPFELAPLEVTATRSPRDPLASPLASTTLGPDQLRLEQSVSLAHAIEELPGVRTLSTGSQIGKPMIRGLTGQRVLVLDNGLRLEDYSWSDEDGPSVDARLADRIEVIRGPQSVLYGSDALGGVVNAISAELPNAASGPGFHRGSVELYGATNNAELGTALRFEGAKHNIGWRIFGVGRRAASLHTPAGELDNTGFLAINGDAALGFKGPRGGVEFRLAHYGGEFHLLEANGPPPGAQEGEEAGPVRKALDDRLQVRADRVSGVWRLEAKGQFQRHSLIEVSDEANPNGGAGETTAFDLLLNTLSVDLLAHRVASERFHSTLGVSLAAQSNSTRGPIPLVPNASVRSGAGFVFVEAGFGRVSLLGGARFDARHLSADANPTLGNAADSRSYGAFSGNAGIVVRPIAELAIAANLGRAWRAPNFFELYTNGPNLAEARYEIGDATLKTEHATSFEGSIRWQHPRIRGEITAYHNRVGRYIYLSPTTETLNGLKVYRHLQADADLDGAEASLELAPVSVLSLRGRVDGVRASNKTTNEPLPLTPPLRTAFAAELHTSGKHWADRARLQLEVQNVAKQTRLNALDVPVDGYTLFGIEAGLEGGVLPGPMRLDLTVRNLANLRYRDFLSRYKEFADNPGRDITIRLSLPF